MASFKLAELFVELASKGFDKVQSQVISLKNNLGQLSGTFAGGLGVSISAAAIVAAMKSSYMAFEDARLAAARLDATLQLAGGTIGRTSYEIQNLSSDLAKLSNFQDDAIAGAAAMLAEFQNLRGDQFDAALKSVVDLASRTGDLSGSARGLGAALDDPINNVSLLRRQYKAFSADVAENAKEMAKSGDIVGAQNLILQELKRTTGGMAESMRSPVQQLKNSFGELGESIGRNMETGLGVTKKLEGGVQRLNSFVKALDAGKVSDFVNAWNPLTNLAEQMGILGSVVGDRSERAAAEARAAKGAARHRAQQTDEDRNAEALERLRNAPETKEKRLALIDQIDAKGAPGILGEQKQFQVQLKQYRANLEDVYADASEIEPLIQNLQRQFDIQQSHKMMRLMSNVDAESAENVVAEQIRFNQHLKDIRNELADAGKTAGEITEKLESIRAKFEKDKANRMQDIRIGIDADTLTGPMQTAAQFAKQARDLVKQMQDAGFGADEIAQARDQLLGKFKRESGEKQGDIFKSLLTAAAPERIKRKLEIDFNAAELKKKIEDAFPDGMVPEELLGTVEELRQLQQKREILDQRKAPEFVGITEMARKIQSLVAGEGTAAIEKRQAEILQDIKDLGQGKGLNVNLGKEAIQAIADAAALG